MLYKHIIIPHGIPFSLSIPVAPMSWDEMDEATFNAVMQRGYDEAKTGLSRPADEVFSELRWEI